MGHKLLPFMQTCVFFAPTHHKLNFSAVLRGLKDSYFCSVAPNENAAVLKKVFFVSESRHKLQTKSPAATLRHEIHN